MKKKKLRKSLRNREDRIRGGDGEEVILEDIMAYFPKLIKKIQTLKNMWSEGKCLTTSFPK